MDSSGVVAILGSGQAQDIDSQHVLCRLGWEPKCIQVVVLFPVAESQFGLDQPIVGEWEKLSGATVFAAQSMVHGRPNVKFGLHVHNMGETKIDTLGLEKWLGKKIVDSECRSPEGLNWCTLPRLLSASDWVEDHG